MGIPIPIPKLPGNSGNNDLVGISIPIPNIPGIGLMDAPEKATVIILQAFLDLEI